MLEANKKAKAALCARGLDVKSILKLVSSSQMDTFPFILRSTHTIYCSVKNVLSMRGIIRDLHQRTHSLISLKTFCAWHFAATAQNENNDDERRRRSKTHTLIKIEYGVIFICYTLLIFFECL